MRAMLLAAGRGERMRPLTDSVPKPLLKAGGRSLIEWNLAALARAGIREVIVNVSWLGGQLRAALGDGREFGIRIHWSEEGPVPLETGGGILHALPLLGREPFLLASSDIWSDIDFARLRLEPDAAAHLLLVPNPPHLPRGDFGLEGDLVVERDSGRFTYANVGIYRPEMFAGFAPGRFPLRAVLTRAIAARRVRGELHRGEWLDVGTPERLAALDKRLRALE
jgi:N-acetyl-alpha-D-muramate 1-phosphate uridylyltransferase